MVSFLSLNPGICISARALSTFGFPFRDGHQLSIGLKAVDLRAILAHHAAANDGHAMFLLRRSRLRIAGHGRAPTRAAGRGDSSYRVDQELSSIHRTAPRIESEISQTSCRPGPTATECRDSTIRVRPSQCFSGGSLPRRQTQRAGQPWRSLGKSHEAGHTTRSLRMAFVNPRSNP